MTALASKILSFDSAEAGFVSFEKRDGKLVVRVFARSGLMSSATIPGEAVEHLACFNPEARS